MLHFFRKYQKILFLFTTIIIVFTFVFFGTYQAIAPSFSTSGNDEAVFQAIDGRKIRRSYLDQMMQVLNTEIWMHHPNPLAMNFLNDSVVSEEFLEAGIASSFFAGEPTELQEKLNKEKKYTPYTHPHSPSLSALNIWQMFAPEIPEKLAKLQESDDAIESLHARVDLFLAEKRFPSNFLTQIIRYQERQLSNFPPDSRLQRENMGLFGYREMSDWFGKDFMQQVCKAIINAAAYARQNGYKISQEEVMTDLLYRSEKAFQAFKNQMEMPVQNSYELFQLYLRQRGLEQGKVVKIWEDITLFRRLLGDVGQAARVDPLALDQFYAFAHENATIELYQMPAALRFKSDDELRKFETYLEIVGDNWDEKIKLPLEYASIETIEAKAPELVGTKYQIEYAEVNKKALQSKVTMKETWDWEVDAHNYGKLTQRFPDLANSEKKIVLDKLDAKKRKLIDIYAREQIVEDHSEWIQIALQEAKMNRKDVFLTAMSEKPLPGIADSEKFQALLNTQDEIQNYTQDNQRFYSIIVKERGEKEVLSFDSAKSFLEATSNIDVEDYKSRFTAYMERYRRGEIDEKIYESPLAKQWKIEKSQKTLTRSEPHFLDVDDVLNLEESYSEVIADEKEGAYFYRKICQGSESSIPQDKLALIQQMLSKEAKSRYLEKLMLTL